MPRWVMVIDLRKCVGCETCKMVCTDVNKVPPGASWKKVSKISNSEELSDIYIPLNCMHCSNPPCKNVCPTSATFRRNDGVVDIDYGLCIGCGACIMACPYNARHISFEDKVLDDDLVKLKKPVEKYDRIGICTKCNFCINRLEQYFNKGVTPDKDKSANPYCVQHCISEAVYFGDLDDPSSKVSRLLKENKTIQLNQDLNTDPSVFYIFE